MRTCPFAEVRAHRKADRLLRVGDSETSPKDLIVFEPKHRSDPPSGSSMIVLQWSLWLRKSSMTVHLSLSVDCGSF